ncbi:MAG: hypothetical protein ACO3YU_10610, partial [Candidatus Nanopelagicales bacterium]
MDGPRWSSLSPCLTCAEHEMHPSLEIRDSERERRIFVVRAWVLFVLAMLALGGLVLRMVQLQVWDHDKYSTRSERNRIQLEPIAPPRGLIFDRQGTLLASNRPVFSLAHNAERKDRSVYGE